MVHAPGGRLQATRSAAATQRLRVLALSSLFPSQTRPTFGIFVRERVRHVAAHCDLLVVAPVPWFPFNRLTRGREQTPVPSSERQAGMIVYHPRVLSPPGVAKSLDGLLYVLSIVPFLLRLRRRFPFDLIDAHFGYPDGVAAACLGRLFRCPVLITLRGDEQRLSGFALRRPQLRWALRSARVIAVSQSLAQLAIGLGAAPDRIRVISNGVDPAQFHPTDRQAARRQLGIAADRPVLVAVGHLVERKGHQRMVEILPDLISHTPNLLYVAVGNESPGGAHRRVIEKLVHRQQLENHVRIAAGRPHTEIPVWLAAADLFCLATASEGCCNAILEALACGLPVVTTRVGGNPDLVRDGEDGILVPFWHGAAFAAAIVRALNHPWDRAAIVARARARGWDRTAAAVLEEFRRACRER